MRTSDIKVLKEMVRFQEEHSLDDDTKLLVRNSVGQMNPVVGIKVNFTEKEIVFVSMPSTDKPCIAIGDVKSWFAQILKTDSSEDFKLFYLFPQDDHCKKHPSSNIILLSVYNREKVNSFNFPVEDIMPSQNKNKIMSFVILDKSEHYLENNACLIFDSKAA